MNVLFEKNKVNSYRLLKQQHTSTSFSWCLVTNATSFVCMKCKNSIVDSPMYFCVSMKLFFCKPCQMGSILNCEKNSSDGHFHYRIMKVLPLESLPNDSSDVFPLEVEL